MSQQFDGFPAYLEAIRQLAVERAPNFWGVRNAEIRWDTTLDVVPRMDKEGVYDGTTHAMTEGMFGIIRVHMYALAFRKTPYPMPVVLLHELGHAANMGEGIFDAAHDVRWAEACRAIGLVQSPYQDWAEHKESLSTAHLDDKMKKAVSRLKMPEWPQAIKDEWQRISGGAVPLTRPWPEPNFAAFHVFPKWRAK